MSGYGDELPPLPWEGENTDLARAYALAFERSNAVAGVPDADVTVTGTPTSRALMVSGTDLDADELQLYAASVAHAYGELIEEAGEDEERRGALLRGLAVFHVLVGDFHARARLAREATLDKGREATSGKTRAAPELKFSVPGALRELTAEQRRELGRDSVQVVLDLEADRMERLAPALDALGLGAIAALMRAAAIALRDALEHDGTAQ